MKNMLADLWSDLLGLVGLSLTRKERLRAIAKLDARRDAGREYWERHWAEIQEKKRLRHERENTENDIGSGSKGKR